MSWAVVAGAGIVGGIGLIGTLIANDAASDAASTAATAATEAASTEAEAAQAAIDEQARQFAAMQELMAPWVAQGTESLAGLQQYEEAGSDALARQRALMGLDGQDAQRAAIEGIASSAEMAGLYTQGENALMQSGAATGGLRGGNTQAALAQFRPQMLSGLINQQYSKLGGLIDMGQGITMNRAALGQASAAGVGAAGMQSASSIGNLLLAQGNATAGGILGAGNANAAAQLASGNAWANLPQTVLQGGLLGYGLANPRGF